MILICIGLFTSVSMGQVDADRCFGSAALAARLRETAWQSLLVRFLAGAAASLLALIAWMRLPCRRPRGEPLLEDEAHLGLKMAEHMALFFLHNCCEHSIV